MKLKNGLLKISLYALVPVLAAGLAVRSQALGSGSSDNWAKLEGKTAAPDSAQSLYDQGVLADKSGENQAALKYFQQALKKDKKNADILNMLAHSERKLGMINEAIDDYWKALKIRPRFPEAREYMGEAYIQATLKEIETLKSYGKDGEEAREDLIKAFKAAAAGLETEAPAK